MNGARLKKCPVCGADAAMNDGGFFYWVKCRGCGLMTEIVATPEEAAGLWNPRMAARRTVLKKQTVLTEETVCVEESRYVIHKTETVHGSAVRC